MNGKSEWETVHREILEDQRRRAGDPPTAEEVMAYMNGELSAEEEERVRDLLICYPELLRTLTTPFPEESKPGEPGYVSDAEMKRRWLALQKAMRVPNGVAALPRVDLRLLQRWRRSALALAAGLVLAVGVASWLVHVNRREALEPRVVWTEQLLLPGGHRGAADSGSTLVPEGDAWMLVLPLMNVGQFREYSAAIVDLEADPPERVWSRKGLPPGDDDAFRILVPRSFLAPGRYEVRLYGTDGGDEKEVSRYPLRVAAP